VGLYLGLLSYSTFIDVFLFFTNICYFYYYSSVVWFKVIHCCFLSGFLHLLGFFCMCFHMNVRIIFPISVKNVIVISMECHWKCRSLSVKFPFSQDLLYPSKIIGRLVILYCLYKFLSSMFHNFHWRHLSPP
jgi:hypothetical protein